MRIVHLCISCFFNDGRSYQENELIRQHVQDGHQVLVLASTETIRPDGTTEYVVPQEYLGPEGARVIRLAYRLWPHKLARKLRMHRGVYKLLADFKPDSILFHGASGWELGTVARYAKDNPTVRFYIDSHEDHNNSGRTFLSLNLLHKIYYRYCLSRAWPIARKVLCISTETIEFVHGVYKVPRDKLEFFPLGGQLVEAPIYAKRRSKKRLSLGLNDGQILFVQSGKQTERKKLLEALRAFKHHAPAQSRLAVAGSLSDGIRTEAEQLMATMPNVMFLGWQNTEDLTDLLCAADVYLQPGTQSVTMQHSLCCHCAVILDDVPSHQVFKNENGWFINNNNDLENAIRNAATADLQQMGQNSFALARKMLDYKTLSKRIFED